MAEFSNCNLHVYREGRKRVPAQSLVHEARAATAKVRSLGPEDAVLGALLRGGELECGLCDAGRSDSEFAAAATDHLAILACNFGRPGGADERAIQSTLTLLSRIQGDGELTVSRPEGFAYYALHPLGFADLVSSLQLNAGCAFVVGIRSIGAVLSAVVAARLRGTGIAAARTTVRPFGHPYDRRAEFSVAQRVAIRQALSQEASFLVCDEGPGRSGSSFLSVAEALEGEGVGRERVILLCSNQPDVDALCAPDASQRWRRYRSLASGTTRRLPAQAGLHIGGGEWRRFLVPPDRPWPAAWPQTERLKYLSRDGRKLLKFEGYGPYGEAVRRREELLAEGGWCMTYAGQEAGFGTHELVRGCGGSLGDNFPALSRRVAEYCSWRASSLFVGVSDQANEQLKAMTISNLEEEFGWAPDLRLEVVRPAICDGRMQPSKWRCEGEDRWTKLDASTHGDDHFFPGPTDIAWDLAGVRVEWNLDAGCRRVFLADYACASGDHPAPRFPDYELAYAAFRMAWCKMGALSVRGMEDEPRLRREYWRYRLLVEDLLRVRRQSLSRPVYSLRAA